MEEQAKIQVLLASAEARHKAIHIMRERVHKTCLWFMGICFAIIGWIIKENITLSLIQKVVVVSVIAIIVLVFHRSYLRDIMKGFKAQQRVLARIEDALKLYQPGVYDDAESGLFPNTWKQAGTSEGSGRFFLTNLYLLYIGAVSLILVIILQGWITPCMGENLSTGP